MVATRLCCRQHPMAKWPSYCWNIWLGRCRLLPPLKLEERIAPHHRAGHYHGRGYKPCNNGTYRFVNKSAPAKQTFPSNTNRCSKRCADGTRKKRWRPSRFTSDQRQSGTWSDFQRTHGPLDVGIRPHSEEFVKTPRWILSSKSSVFFDTCAGPTFLEWTIANVIYREINSKG